MNQVTCLIHFLQRVDSESSVSVYEVPCVLEIWLQREREKTGCKTGNVSQIVFLYLSDDLFSVGELLMETRCQALSHIARIMHLKSRGIFSE